MCDDITETLDGKGNEVAYNDENTIRIDYKDVDGDGLFDTLCVNEDNQPTYKIKT